MCVQSFSKERRTCEEMPLHRLGSVQWFNLSFAAVVGLVTQRSKDYSTIQHFGFAPTPPLPRPIPPPSMWRRWTCSWTKRKCLILERLTRVSTESSSHSGIQAFRKDYFEGLKNIPWSARNLGGVNGLTFSAEKCSKNDINNKEVTCAQLSLQFPFVARGKKIGDGFTQAGSGIKGC